MSPDGRAVGHAEGHGGKGHNSWAHIGAAQDFDCFILYVLPEERYRFPGTETRVELEFFSDTLPRCGDPVLSRTM